MRKKRAITILEIMIAIFLIGIIGGVVGYNLKGSMDKGRAFKTEQAMQRVKEILYLVAGEQNLTVSEVVNDPRQYLIQSGLVKNPDDLLKDGWGGELSIYESTEKDSKGEIETHSKNLEKYRKKMNEKSEAKK
jgi:general secretion pathway protein G